MRTKDRCPMATLKFQRLCHGACSMPLSLRVEASMSPQNFVRCHGLIDVNDARLADA